MGHDTQKDTVHLGDCKKYEDQDATPRKLKPTDFFLDILVKNSGMNKKSDDLLNPPPGLMKSMFDSKENS